MRPHVPSLAIILGPVSLAQAAAYDRRQEPATNSMNLADGFMSMFNRLGAAQTVTETVRQTITVGGGGGGGLFVNATGAVTVTVTAPASTVTVCPGQAQGAVDGVQGGDSTSAAVPVVVATGGVGVTVIVVPDDARKTSLVGNNPAATSSSLAPLPTQGGTDQPGLSTDLSATSLAPLPTLETSSAASDPSAVPIVGAPISDGTSASSLAPLPGLASSLSNTLVLPSTGNAAVATPVSNPAGAFGGSAGVIPMDSAAIVPPTPTTPAVANGAGAAPTIDVSGLTLSSQLNLGNLGKQTPAANA